jgi:hypothetical protein
MDLGDRRSERPRVELDLCAIVGVESFADSNNFVEDLRRAGFGAGVERIRLVAG